jgi:hypothetical protein
MSDLATALKTAINKLHQEKQMRTHTPEDIKTIADAWAKDDPRDDARTRLPHAFKPTNNVSRETFNAVRDNPRLLYKDLVTMLGNRGFNTASIGSLLTQMLNCGMITRDDNGRYVALQAEYTPIKAAKKKKVAVPAAKKPNAGIAALGAHEANKATTPLAPKTVTVSAFDPEQLLSTLSFSQVMALYKKIKTMVGEA